MRGTQPPDERAQAYTLEGVIGGIIIVMAVLLAYQSLIVTPTTTGAVDPGTRAELSDQADDVLAITAQNESFGLSELVRYWDGSARTFAGPDAVNPRVGYGENEPPKAFGRMMNHTFRDRGYKYNVEMHYQLRNVTDGQGEVPLVYRGDPSNNAAVATYSVTLFDNQSLTSPNSPNAELWEYDTNATNNVDGYYPIPDAVPEGPVYNVVEVRVTVW